MEGWLQKIKKSWYKIYFMMAILMVFFAYGVTVGRYNIFPYKVLRDAKRAAQDWITDDNYKQYLKIRPQKFIRPARHNGSDVTIYVPDKAHDGVTFITSMWDHTNGMNLIDMDGSVIHEWRVSFNEIWPEASHIRKQWQMGDWWDVDISDWDVDIDGALLYPNGDVIFNFEYMGLVKIDKSSNVIWKLPYITHHSIYEDAEGNLWVTGQKEELIMPVKRLRLLEPPITEDTIIKISPEGEILKEISILDVFYNSGQEALLFTNGKSGPTKRIAVDIMHVNDIDILEESIAEQFLLFEAGDIMVSMRHLNLIIIFGPSTEKIKWSMTGPYIRQHDPDFLDNGHISVFDNRADDAGGKILGGSRILDVDPVTRKVHTIYEGNDQNSFFTNLRGKHQHLPNGNILITENDAGRVFEVTSSGQVVWSFINRYDEDEIYIVQQATRLAKHYKKFAEGAKKYQ